MSASFSGNILSIESSQTSPNTTYFVQVNGPYDVSGEFTSDGANILTITDPNFIDGIYDIYIYTTSNLNVSIVTILGVSKSSSGSGGGIGATFQISYNINGGVGITPGSSTYPAGSTNIPLYSDGGITKDNFSFDGWSLNGSAPGSLTYTGPLESNIQMVAVWTRVSQNNGQTVPAATPTGLTAIAGDARVTLTWDAQAGVTYTLAIVGQDPILNVTSGIIVGVTAGTPTLVNGTLYSFAVKANGNGTTTTDSELSNLVSATPTAVLIAAPSEGVVCFLGSAPVQTPAGWARIDSLAVGDLVRTADGRDVAIVRVKHQRIEAPSAAVNPYVIPAGVWGATENLPISPRHCVAIPGRGMVEARELGLKQMPMRAAFDYYNLELPEWDNMVVAGVEVESLAPKKRVVMSIAQLAGLVAAIPAEKRAKVARLVTVLADGRVAVEMTRKERRMA